MSCRITRGSRPTPAPGKRCSPSTPVRPACPGSPGLLCGAWLAPALPRVGRHPRTPHFTLLRPPVAILGDALGAAAGHDIVVAACACLSVVERRCRRSLPRSRSRHCRPSAAGRGPSVPRCEIATARAGGRRRCFAGTVRTPQGKRRLTRRMQGVDELSQGPHIRGLVDIDDTAVHCQRPLRRRMPGHRARRAQLTWTPPSTSITVPVT